MSLYATAYAGNFEYLNRRGGQREIYKESDKIDNCFNAQDFDFPVINLVRKLSLIIDLARQFLHYFFIFISEVG